MPWGPGHEMKSTTSSHLATNNEANDSEKRHFPAPGPVADDLHVSVKRDATRRSLNFQSPQPRVPFAETYQVGFAIDGCVRDDQEISQEADRMSAHN